MAAPNARVALDQSIFTFQALQSLIETNLPLFFHATLILTVGFLGGKTVGNIIKKFLTMTNVDGLAARLEFQSILRSLGYTQSVSDLLSSLVKWFIYIIAILAVIQLFEFELLIQLFITIRDYIPKIILAIIVIIFGFMISDNISKIIKGFMRESGVDSMTEESGISLSSFTANIVKYSLYLISIITALSIVGIGTATLQIAFTALIIGVVLLGVVGLKDLTPNIMAGIYLHLADIVNPGDDLIYGDIRGIVEGVGPIYTRLSSKKEILAIPNSLLIKDTIKIQR